jgi:L-asparagine transporter-like permease
MNRKTRKKKKSPTFTKVWVNRLLWLGVSWVFLSFVLAFMGRENIAESISVTGITEIIAVSLGYFIKSVVETDKEEKMKYRRDSNNVPRSDEDNT